MKCFALSVAAGLVVLTVWNAEASACGGRPVVCTPVPAPVPQPVATNSDDTDLDRLLDSKQLAAKGGNLARRRAAIAAKDEAPRRATESPKTPTPAATPAPAVRGDSRNDRIVR